MVTFIEKSGRLKVKETAGSVMTYQNLTSFLVSSVNARSALIYRCAYNTALTSREEIEAHIGHMS
jgi:hypothetical protein